jgi:tetratricopeptide (TPR) repeat protein
LRDYSAAEVDLLAALKLDEAYVPAQLEMARVLSRRGDSSRALALVAELLQTDEKHLRATALALRGELHAVAGNTTPAIADLTAALAVRPEVEWYLLRAELQQSAGDQQSQLTGLREGWRLTASPVLQHAYCDALITGTHQQRAEAAAMIEAELRSGRYHSAWLLRRAQVHLAEHDRRAADVDLQTALSEVQSRLNPARPDPTLLAERNAICRLLGTAPPATKVDLED